MEGERLGEGQGEGQGRAGEGRGGAGEGEGGRVEEREEGRYGKERGVKERRGDGRGV